MANSMTSREYWRQRELLHIAEMKNAEDQYDKEITAIYDAALSGIQTEIEAFYQRYATAEGLSLLDAKRKVDAADIRQYEALAKKLSETMDRSPEYDDAMRLYNAKMKINRLELLKSKIGRYCAELGDDVQKYMDQTLTEEAEAEARRQAGILGATTTLDDPDDIKKIVRGSWRTDLSKVSNQTTFSERIWGHNEKLQSNLSVLLTQSIIAGKGPVEIARDLRKQFDSSKYEADRLMRTESARVQTQIQSESIMEAGYDMYEFISEPTACSDCLALNSESTGIYFRVTDIAVGINAPPMHPNCRCAICAHTNEINFYVGENGKAISSEYASWIGDNQMKRYLDEADTDIAKRYIKSDYRKTSFIGDGSTAAIRKFEIETGLNCGRNRGSHAVKVKDLIRQINKSLLKELTDGDRIMLEKMLNKLKEVDEN